MSNFILGDLNTKFKVGGDDCSIYLGTTKLYPNDVYYKLVAQYSDGSEYKIECDGTSTLTAAEVSEHTTPKSAMTEATIGDCITSIDFQSFQNCTSLTSVNIPNTVTSIGNQVFRGSTSLTGITIPDSVTSIGQDAFGNCTGLTSATIGSGVTVIEQYLFRGCSSLTGITIPNNITNIKTQAFGACTSLTSVTIPNSVTNMGYSVFSGCTSLTSVNIPSGITSIGNFCFYDCGLTSIEIPSGITSIGHQAFYYCTRLQSITVKALTPPTLVNSNAFNNTGDCPIYVPCESVEAYKTAWSTYASRITCIPTYQYVDLGLPSGTLWATMNIGASSETDYGNYYKYGYGTKQYSAETTSVIYYTGTENPLASSADTVAQEWGGNWHTPTFTQFQELSANTTYTWETDFNGSGINGSKFTAQNGKYVFFPAGGNWNDGTQTNVGSYGYYWGSTPADSQPTKNAYYMSVGSGSPFVNIYYRYAGYNIRGVIG